MKYLKIIFFVFLTVSCKTTNKILVKSEISNSYKIVAWYDDEQKDIWALSIPISLIVENTSFFEIETFISHQYIYENPKQGTHAFLYELGKSKELKKKKNYARKNINPNTKKKYIIYSKHLISDKRYSDKLMSIYKNIDFQTDSVSLDFFDDFKKKLPDLVEEMFVKDSLFLRFRNKDKGSKLSTKRIKVPIEGEKNKIK